MEMVDKVATTVQDVLGPEVEELGRTNRGGRGGHRGLRKSSG